jgi:three-Cys-motif partner protein
MPKKKFGNRIGPWTEKKLKFVLNYLLAYSNILDRTGYYPDYRFIDAFCGNGFCARRSDGNIIRGSAVVSLCINPPFKKYYFIDSDRTKTTELQKTIDIKFTKLKNNISVYCGDANKIISEVLNDIPDNIPFMALLDPQAGDLEWDTIIKISQKNKSEILINFPFGMAINRSMPLVSGESVDEEKISLIFGNNDWKSVYSERRSRSISPMTARDKYLNLYLNGLIALDYRFYCVKNIKNSQGSHIYYLIFASKNIKGLEKIKDEFVKNEPERNTLLFLLDLENELYPLFKGRGNIKLKNILEVMLPGKHLYKKQDFKEVLKNLEKKSLLKRVTLRARARSFVDDDLFTIE